MNRWLYKMKNKQNPFLLVSILAAGCFLFTGCRSFTGERLGLLYLMLLWIGMPAGFFLSAAIWGNDDAGSYTPVWEVLIWFALVVSGVVLAYVKPFCVFSGFAVVVIVPSAGMIPVTFIMHVLKKHRKQADDD
jgi:hypothetical protein